MENIVFTITGKIPSKKNLWHTGRGRIYADSSVEEFVNSAYLEIKSQLKKWKVIEGPVILDVCFLMDERGDLDNKISMICDLLQKIKMIADDRQIRRINAWREKVKSSESRASINLVEVGT